MDYVRKKGSSRGTGSGREAVAAFNRSMRESVGDGGEQVGDVSHDYGVSPSDVKGTAEPMAEDEAYMDEVLKGAGYKYVKTSERGRHYAMPVGPEGGDRHTVVVSRESTGGFQARLRTARGRVAYFDSVDELQAGIPRRHRRAAESIGKFWARYLRD